MASLAYYFQDEEFQLEADEQARTRRQQQQQQLEDGRSSGSSSPDLSSASESEQQAYSDDEQRKILILDPSEHFRPEASNKELVHQKQAAELNLDTHGKSVEEFRKYSEDEEDYIQRRVKRTYHLMHRNQTVDFVRSRIAKWSRFNHAELTIMEALVKLNVLIDESDPDSDLPNIVHAFQTAERIRAEHPDKPWFHLTGLIHDLGKIMALWGEQQWAVVGDTYIVGAQFAQSIVYRESSFDQCPDLMNPHYNTKYGIYKPRCGLDNVLFSWGHDEYMARVLQNHAQCSLPAEAVRIIRLHSFYPWHTGGDYMHLCTDEDLQTMELIREFNKYDLYTKSAPVPNIDELMPYYQGLIDQYIPGKLKW